MPTRKNNAAQPRQGRCKNCSGSFGEISSTPPRDIEAMLMIGTEPVAIHSVENENIDFMAELIDP